MFVFKIFFFFPGYDQILAEVQDITRPSTSTHTIKHSITHHIITTGSSTLPKPRRMSPEKLKIPKKSYDTMDAEGQVSKSQWSSPLHVVDKRSQEWRPAGDFRRLSLMATGDCSPISHIQDHARGLQSKYNCF